MERLLQLADDKKIFKAAERRLRYYENHKEEISAKRAKKYVENKNKKYETGIGLRQIEALQKEDFEKYQVAKEWINILQADGCDRATMDLISTNLKVDWKYDGEIVPLRISVQELQEPSVVKLLRFLELTPPNADMMLSFSNNSKNDLAIVVSLVITFAKHQFSNLAPTPNVTKRTKTFLYLRYVLKGYILKDF